MIEYDLTKVKGLKKQFIRVERMPKLEKLDIDFMKALEDGDTDAQADIASKKQRLRDAPADSAIDAATTVEEVKAVRPSILDET